MQKQQRKWACSRPPNSSEHFTLERMSAEARKVRRSNSTKKNKSETSVRHEASCETIGDQDILQGNENPEELTKEALSALLLQKNELEAKGVEIEIMYNELMSTISPWRQRKLQQELTEVETALKESTKKFYLLFNEARSSFENYQNSTDGKQRDEAAGDLFWKCKQMHNSTSSALSLAAKSEKMRAHLEWNEKMTQVAASMTNIFRLVDDMKKQLAKERVLTKTLATMVQKAGGSDNPQLAEIIREGESLADASLSSSSSTVSGDSGSSSTLFGSLVLIATMLFTAVWFVWPEALPVDLRQYIHSIRLPHPKELLRRTSFMMGLTFLEPEPEGWLASIWKLILNFGHGIIHAIMPGSKWADNFLPEERMTFS